MSEASSDSYEVRLLSRRVQRELDSIPANYFPRILQAIEALADTPRPNGAIHLENDIYRLRVGQFRVLYRIDDGLRKVDIGAIRRRSERTYRRVRSLF